MKIIIRLAAALLLAALFITGCDTGTVYSETGHTGTDQTETALEKTLVGISVTKAPAKTEYFIDENLDLEGIEVTAAYSDNTTEKVTIGVSNVTGFDSDTAGDKTLTVTYNGKTTAFTVTVDNVTLTRIDITAEPVKTEYWMYESLDLGGLEVTATLSDKTARELSIHELEITGFDPNTAGEQTITVSFTGTGIGNGKSDTFTVTVTAKTFTITFDKNGGDGEASPQVKTVIQPAPGVDSLPTPPARAGYNFTGWNTQEDGSGNSFTADNLVTGSFTVYAQWFKPVITFNSNGGSPVIDQPVNYGEIAEKPTDPVRTGYNSKFGGWYTDDAFTNLWDFNNPVTIDIDLHAKWAPYALGDTGPGGGKIFYRIETGFPVTGGTPGTGYYLEAAPADFASSIQWGANGDNLTTGTAIGTGKQNTQIIVALLNKDGEKNRAAQLCVDLNSNGFTDWFLPSKDELYQLLNNKTAAGITLETGSSRYYWSSSQGNTAQQAWAYLSYTTITDSSRNRTNESLVRAIRAF